VTGAARTRYQSGMKRHGLRRAILLALGVGALLAGCGRVAQAPECAAYVECVKARDVRQQTATDVVRFEPAGACYPADTAEAAPAAAAVVASPR